jgi:S1-C subfamily serine protease
MGELGRTVGSAILLGAQLGIPDHARPCNAHAYVADAAVVQRSPTNNDLCGWIGTGVSPMTAAFAESLGMAEPYGAIFDQPEPGSPAAQAHIEQGDVLTSINGAPLTRASDFAGIISAMAPGTTVYLATWRDGEARQVTLTLGAAPCRASG